MDLNKVEILTNHILSNRAVVRSYHIGSDHALNIVEYHNGCRKIILNRAKALNSLSFEMLQNLKELLNEYNKDHRVTAVLICSNSNNIFCSGGDIKQFSKLAMEDPIGLNYFLRVEYHINHLIYTFSKPIISFVNGVVMGGGVGLSLHCKLRVITENSLWAMPENFIGFIPDVGTTYFVSRLKSIGLMLELTATRIKYKDMMLLDIGTHFIQSHKLQGLMDEICEMGNIDLSKIKQVLNANCMDKSQALASNLGKETESFILKYKHLVEEYFNWDLKTLQAIYDKLAEASVQENSTGSWCLNMKRKMDLACPTSLMTNFEMLHRGVNLSYEECISNEVRVGSRVAIRGDIREGVCSAVIDKSYKPKYNPKNINQVSLSSILAFFEPLDKNLELTFHNQISKL